jgi:hypothetical protein
LPISRRKGDNRANDEIAIRPPIPTASDAGSEGNHRRPNRKARAEYPSSPLLLCRPEKRTPTTALSVHIEQFFVTTLGTILRSAFPRMDLQRAADQTPCKKVRMLSSLPSCPLFSRLLILSKSWQILVLSTFEQTIGYVSS